MRVYTFKQDKSWIEHRLDTEITNKHAVKGHGGDFLVFENLDKTELKLYHISNEMLMPQTIYIDGKRMNFALSKVDGSTDSFNLIACTFDAKWNNKCELYPIDVLPPNDAGLSWL